MKLAHPDFENPIFLPEQHVGFLVMENPQRYYQLARELIRQVDDDEGDFVLSDQYKAMSIPKILAVIDHPLGLDPNPRRAITELYKQLEKHCVEEAVMLELQELMDTLSINLKRLLPELEVELEEIETPAWSALFKLFDLRFRSNYPRLEEALLDYLRIIRRYLKMQFFVVIGAIPFITAEGLNELSRQAEYEDLRILFLENDLPVEKQPEGTRALIQDEDLCEIIRYNDEKHPAE